MTDNMYVYLERKIADIVATLGNKRAPWEFVRKRKINNSDFQIDIEHYCCIGEKQLWQ